MGGSGGGSLWTGPSQSSVNEQAETSLEEFNTQLSELLSDCSARINSRDTEESQDRKDAILSSLSDDFDNIQMHFGGSVAKRTYVEGLSDVDTLLIVSEEEGKELSPDELKSIISSRLSDKFSDATVSLGKVAITLNFPDGAELQIVPSRRVGDKLQVPSWTGTQWSSISPQSFTKALTRHNEKNNGKLIPTIKLAKAVIAGLPIADNISGYHVEAMAINAFRGYDGARDVTKMLPLFFDKASKIVLKPIKDSTGQSVNVDSYLGRVNSLERKKVAHMFEAVARRMRNASVVGSKEQWKKLFKKLDD